MTELKIGKRLLDSSKKTLIMGVLNVTPDSFSDGGKFNTVDAAINHARQMVEKGADIIDVGGESTRPGAKAVSASDELHRVLPVIEQVVESINVPVSIDTYKSRVAEKAIDAGALLVNDITAMQGDRRMVNVIADHNVHVCLMHMKGNPRTMQLNPEYKNLIHEIRLFLKERADYALFHGISKDRILFDPGIGFGKRTGRGVEDNCDILHHLSMLKEEGFPVLVGASRKTFIGNVSGGSNALPVSDRLEGSIAAACIAAYNGADVIRVHDVAETRKAVDVVDCILGKSMKKNDEHVHRLH
ncbi:MAG: dihydropteroate synthase [Candidatus Thermoplasmatota archaeon]|nr:dihydropteroate synthase [Candidatus Thermoplasmatota archaeon]